MQGIYKIENKKTGKVYIGSSNDVVARMKDHKRELNKGRHHSVKLQRSWTQTKNPNERFDFCIVEDCESLSRDETFKREEYWIDYYDSIKNGYNMVEVGKMPKTKKQKQKISKKRLMAELTVVENEFNDWVQEQYNPYLTMKFKARNKDFTKVVYQYKKDSYYYYKKFYNFVEKTILPIYKDKLVTNINVVLEIQHYLQGKGGLTLYALAELEDEMHLWWMIAIGEIEKINERNGGNLTEDEVFAICLNNDNSGVSLTKVNILDKQYHWFDDRFLYTEPLKTPMFGCDNPRQPDWYVIKKPKTKIGIKGYA